METSQCLQSLKLLCNVTVLPNFIGRLQNLVGFSFKSDNLKHLPATVHELLGEPTVPSLNGPENLEAELGPASIQQTALVHFSSLRYLCLEGCKGLEYIPQLPPDLLSLVASGCTSLQKISDVSMLKSLEDLNLGGCKLLIDVPGLKNIASSLESLEFPGPCNFTDCCHLSRDFKTEAFKDMVFESLKSFKMSGSIVRGSATGEQMPQFMLPRLSFSWISRAWLSLSLDEVDSPIHAKVMDGDIIVFEGTVEVNLDDEVELNMREEVVLETGQGEHCYSIQVVMDVSRLKIISVILGHRSQRYWFWLSQDL